MDMIQQRLFTLLNIDLVPGSNVHSFLDPTSHVHLLDRRCLILLARRESLEEFPPRTA